MREPRLGGRKGGDRQPAQVSQMPWPRGPFTLTPPPCSEEDQHCEAHSRLPGLLKNSRPWPGLLLAQLTADRNTTFFSPHSGVCGVAPGSLGAAIRIAAEILLQVGPRMRGEVDAGREGHSGTFCVLLPLLACEETGLPSTHSGLCG